VLEGETKAIDVLEIEAEGRKAYMITNGGLGLPAETADFVNSFRSWVIRTADCQDTAAHWRPVLKLGEKLIKRAGSRIYEIALAGKITTQWRSEPWHVEIEMPGREPFTTDAPLILVNNQKSLGARYTLAPLTSNTDGTFNLLLVPSHDPTTQVRALLKIRAGRIPDPRDCPRFETTSCVIRSLPGSRPLTFFGDGEILHRNADRIAIRCLRGELPVIVKRAA